VNVTQVGETFERNIHGHFIEHIGRCLNQGIWAELMLNRKFEDADLNGDGVPDPWLPHQADSQIVYRPTHESSGCGDHSLLLHCLRADGRERGIRQAGIAVQGGQAYRVAIWCRGENVGRFSVSLGDVATKIGPPGARWGRYELILMPNASNEDASLTITLNDRGKLWVESVSVMSDDIRDGLRPDVVGLAKALRPATLRWPGGCFADGYHWEDGLRDRDKRPWRWDPAWKNLEANDFGTDEFILFCRAIGAQPFITANFGTDTPEDAAAWVDYCNGTKKSEQVIVRSQMGHPEPYQVKYWGVGNESYGDWEIGSCGARQYAERFLQYREAMLKADPTIKLVAVGADPMHYPDWNKEVLEVIQDRCDYLSLHRYCPGAAPGTDDQERIYHAVVAAPLSVEYLLRQMRTTVDALVFDNKIGIAFDEWNVWLSANRETKWFENYTMRDAIYAAGIFHALHRQAASVTMANLAQLVNVLPAIVTDKTRAYATPIYYACLLYANHCAPITVGTDVSSDTFHAEAVGNEPELQMPVPYVDVSSTLTPDYRTVHTAVINRHPTEDCRARISLRGCFPRGQGQAVMLSAPDAMAANTFDDPERVRLTEFPLQNLAEDFEHVFPAASVTVLKIAI